MAKVAGETVSTKLEVVVDDMVDDVVVVLWVVDDADVLEVLDEVDVVVLIVVFVFEEVVSSSSGQMPVVHGLLAQHPR